MILTREATRTARAVSRLRRAGLGVCHAPVLRIEYDPVCADAIATVSGAQGVLLTSAAAVGAIERCAALRAALHGKRLAVVGTATGAALRRLGLVPAMVGPGSMEGLLQILAPRTGPEDRWIHLAGRDRVALPAACRFPVQVLQIYRAERVPLSAAFWRRVRQRTILGVLFWSRRAALQFTACLGQIPGPGQELVPLTRSWVAACLAPRIVTGLEPAQWRQLVTPDAPDEARLIDRFLQAVQGVPGPGEQQPGMQTGPGEHG